MSGIIRSKDDYVALDHLGNGVFGVVRRIRRRSDNALLVEKAITISGEDTYRVAANEIEVTLRLPKHPNIVHVITSFIEENQLIVIMEFCPDGDLKKEINRQIDSKTRFTENQIRSWLEMLVNAVKFLHDRHIIHRDIKPPNVLLCCDRQIVKLGDFGLAKLMDRPFTSTFAGTPAYMAPEILSSELYDVKVDVWSLGVVLYEMATLKLPSSFPPPVIEHGPYAENIYLLIDSMLTKDPHQRLDINGVRNFPTNLVSTVSVSRAMSVVEVDRLQRKACTLALVALFLSALSLVPLMCSIPAWLELKKGPERLKKVIALSIVAIVFGAIIIFTWSSLAAVVSGGHFQQLEGQAPQQSSIIINSVFDEIDGKRCVGGRVIGEVYDRASDCATACRSELEVCAGYNLQKDSGKCIARTTECNVINDPGAIFYRLGR